MKMGKSTKGGQAPLDLAGTIFLRRSSRRPFPLVFPLLRLSFGLSYKKRGDSESIVQMSLWFIFVYIQTGEFTRCHLPLNTGDVLPTIFRKRGGIPLQRESCRGFAEEYNIVHEIEVHRQSKEKRDFRNFTINIYVYSREIKIYVKIDFKILSSLTWINFAHNNSFVDAYIFSVAY